MSVVSTYGRAAACLVLLLTTACGTVANEDDTAKTATAVDGTTGQKGTAATPAKADMAVKAPGKLKAPLLSSDVLVFSRNTLDKSTIAAIKKVKGIEAVEPISMAQFFVDEQEVTYAAVNPATFRRFSPPGTAQTEEVWNRVADGEIAVEPEIGKKLERKDGFMRLGNESGAHTIHIGAYAQILDPTKARRIDAVVNEKWVKKLGMRKDNAMLVAMDETSPQSVRKKLRKIAGSTASVQILGPDFDLGTQTAFLTGGSVSKAVGSFNYTGERQRHRRPRPCLGAREDHHRGDADHRPGDGQPGDAAPAAGGAARRSWPAVCPSRSTTTTAATCLVSSPGPTASPSTPSARRSTSTPPTTTAASPARWTAGWSPSSRGGASPGAATGTTPTRCTSSWPSSSRLADATPPGAR